MCAQKRGPGACPCKAADVNCAEACKCDKAKCRNEVGDRRMITKLANECSITVFFIYSSSVYLLIVSFTDRSSPVGEPLFTILVSLIA